MFTLSSVCNVALLSLPLISCVLSHPTAETTEGVASILTSVDATKQAFQDLLNDLPEESLLAAVQNRFYPKFKDGSFELSREAMESVHHENPPLATQVMSAALRLELVKRQGGGNQTATSDTASVATSAPEDTPSVADTPTPTPTPTPTSERNTPSATPTAETSEMRTSPSSEAPPPTSAQSSAAPTSDPTIIVPVTRTNSAGNTFISSILQPGGVVTTTNSQGSQVVMTTPRPTTPRAVTMTDEQGSTFVTTITPSGRLITSLVTLTQANAQGTVEVITSIEIIEATDASPEPTGSEVSEPEPSASLQSEGGGYAWVANPTALAAGVVGVAALML
ncbi:hypothetical protein EJ05DRAFT_5599 [Pseudovirgaria hyperparasitica]|uniref:Uncharacterized protein n=1 Tax=Pseudovirgaria hyperparasitica TaxID=470096 RepID=A0A6A6WJR7_9PEZI|nr:uncharacterized protein EJ05DRAFT_5599 [Pseudovirgaria hyperparasitica]KAF2762545.1 hypothetical protein EJ05DRAFT_5599 [Pseudovirgaria hyperparasitica]